MNHEPNDAWISRWAKLADNMRRGIVLRICWRFNEPRHPDSSIPYNEHSIACTVHRHTHTLTRTRTRTVQMHTLNSNEPYSSLWTHSRCVFLFLLWLLMLFLGWKYFRFWSTSAIHTRVSHWIRWLFYVRCFFFFFLFLSVHKHLECHATNGWNGKLNFHQMPMHTEWHQWLNSF